MCVCVYLFLFFFHFFLFFCFYEGRTRKSRIGAPPVRRLAFHGCSAMTRLASRTPFSFFALFAYPKTKHNFAACLGGNGVMLGMQMHAMLGRDMSHPQINGAV